MYRPRPHRRECLTGKFQVETPNLQHRLHRHLREDNLPPHLHHNNRKVIEMENWNLPALVLDRTFSVELSK